MRAKPYRLSFQLYSSRNFPPIKNQLETLARLGFDGVETYPGAYGDDAQGFRNTLDALGLACFSAHMPFDRLEQSRNGLIAEALTLGVETVVAPNIDAANRPTNAAGWAEIGSRLGAHAEALAQHGLKLAWHNHDFEYMALPDGTRPIESLLSRPNVYFEPDIGMMVKAGANPAAEIERYGAQITAFHIKDYAVDEASSELIWTDIGAGRQDWGRIWSAAAATDADLLVCEHDNPKDFVGYATNSSRYLKSTLTMN